MQDTGLRPGDPVFVAEWKAEGGRYRMGGGGWKVEGGRRRIEGEGWRVRYGKLGQKEEV